MQIVRLMGMPDKIIGFDELPEDLLETIEMRTQVSAPRHWREFMGVREKKTKVQPFVDPMTRQLVKCDPITEKGPFAWVIDWEINQDKDVWQNISNYVRRNAPESFRLLDKIEDMAKPLATSVSGEWSLEPEDMIVIPLKKVVKEEPASVVTLDKEPLYKCEECGKEFDKKAGLRLHKIKKHEKIAA